MDLKGGGLRAAEADFFLDGEGRVEIVGWFDFAFFEGAEGFDEHENRGAVIEGFHVDAIAEFHEWRVAGDEIADCDELNDVFFRHAGIDEIVLNLRDFIFFFGGHDVDGLGAHHAEDILATVDVDALGGEGFWIEPADGVEADEALVVDVGDDEADFIHVGGGHGFLFGGAAFFQGDDVAHVVGADFIGEALEFGDDEFADFFFVAGSAGSFTNAGKELDVDRHGGEKIC